MLKTLWLWQCNEAVDQLCLPAPAVNASNATSLCKTKVLKPTLSDSDDSDADLEAKKRKREDALAAVPFQPSDRSLGTRLFEAALNFPNGIPQFSFGDFSISEDVVNKLCLAGILVPRQSEWLDTEYHVNWSAAQWTVSRKIRDPIAAKDQDRSILRYSELSKLELVRALLLRGRSSGVDRPVALGDNKFVSGNVLRSRSYWVALMDSSRLFSNVASNPPLTGIHKAFMIVCWSCLVLACKLCSLLRICGIGGMETLCTPCIVVP